MIPYALPHGIRETGDRHVGDTDPPAAAPQRDLDELTWLRDGQTPQPDRLQQLKDRGGAADGERE